MDYNEHSYLLCSLSPAAGIYQVPLNIQFEHGSDVAFRVDGASKKSKVHLTGFYLTNSLMQSMLMSTPSASAIGVPIKAHQSILVSGKKAKAEGTAKKHVSIREDHEERELSDQDEDRRMNGSNFEDESDSDDDDFGQFIDDDEDFEDEEDEDEDEDDDDLEEMDDSDEGLPEKDSPVGSGKKEKEKPSTPNPWADEEELVGKKKKKKVKPITLTIDEDEETPVVSETPQVQSTPTKKEKKAKGKQQNIPTTPTDSAKKSPAEGFKTPEQNKTIKTPSSVGNTPMKFVAKGKGLSTYLSLMYRQSRMLLVLSHSQEIF